MGIGGSHGLVRMGMTGCADREGDGVVAWLEIFLTWNPKGGAHKTAQVLIF